VQYIYEKVDLLVISLNWYFHSFIEYLVKLYRNKSVAE